MDISFKFPYINAHSHFEPETAASPSMLDSLLQGNPVADAVFANGSFLNDEKQRAITKLVDEHPEWSDARMTDALLQAGAKFGPAQKEALLARFPLKELESVLGKIEMGPAQFTFRGNNEPPFYAVMKWSLRFRATTNGKHDEYTVSVEPFEGRVVAVGRRSRD